MRGKGREGQRGGGGVEVRITISAPSVYPETAAKVVSKARYCAQLPADPDLGLIGGDPW